MSKSLKDRYSEDIELVIRPWFYASDEDKANPAVVGYLSNFLVQAEKALCHDFASINIHRHHASVETDGGVHVTVSASISPMGGHPLADLYEAFQDRSEGAHVPSLEIVLRATEQHVERVFSQAGFNFRFHVELIH